MSGVLIQRDVTVPQSQQQRVGETLVLDNLYYDTLISGTTKGLNAENPLFTSAARIRNDNLCNLKEIGRFSDNKQFAVYCLGLLIWHADDARFIEHIVYHTRMHIQQQDAQKQIVWSDQAPAGGGVYGYDQNAGAFHLTNGIPQVGNQWMFMDPMIIVPQKTFELTLKFMTGRTGAAADPLAYVNADDGDCTLRVYLRGLEGRDPVNG